MGPIGTPSAQKLAEDADKMLVEAVPLWIMGIKVRTRVRPITMGRVPRRASGLAFRELLCICLDLGTRGGIID